MSTIELYNLKDAAVSLLADPLHLYTAFEACEILTDKCGHLVPESDYLDFRKDWLLEQKRRSLQPVPLLPPSGSNSLIPVPRTLEELSSFSQIDIFGTLQGVAKQALRVYEKTDMEGDHKGSIQALRLIMDSSESIDKKLKAMNAKDPSSILLSNIILRNMTESVQEINAEHPDWNLVELIAEKMESRRSKSTAFDMEDE